MKVELDLVHQFRIPRDQRFYCDNSWLLKAANEIESLRDQLADELAMRTHTEKQLSKTLNELAEINECLPDEYSESKDWKHSDTVGRIQWLTSFLQSSRNELNMWCKKCGDLGEQLAECQKDAARYRWLRDTCEMTRMFKLTGQWKDEDGDLHDYRWTSGPASIYFDAAIDAAMKEHSHD